MNITPRERLRLMRELWEMNLSDTTIEAIVQIIESTRIKQGHNEAEAKALKIRTKIEEGISEAQILEFLKQI